MVSELDPDKIIVDCPSVNIQAYTDYFANRLSTAVREKAEIKKLDVDPMILKKINTLNKNRISLNQ